MDWRLIVDVIGQELNNYEAGNLIPPGVYTLDDVKKYGQEKGVCPYFTIRRMVSIRRITSPIFSVQFNTYIHPQSCKQGLNKY